MAGSIRLLIAGGGTGGHVFPLLAVAQAVEKSAPGSNINFVGTPKGIENRLVPEAGYTLHNLRIGGLKGKSFLRRALTLVQLPWAVLVSAFIIARFGPHVVLGGGGYASGPVCLAASMFRLPLALLEVNSLPGYTNRKLARRAMVAFVAFKKTADRLRCPTIVTGNPIRSELRGDPPRPGSEALRLLVLGGSQGAVGLNSLVIDSLPHIKSRELDLSITHQTGSLDLQRVRNAYASHGLPALTVPFIEEMNSAYRNADFVICRAGATTVAELIAARRPAILVPLPTAADNHQEFNARTIADAGCGVIMRQGDTDGAAVADKISGWYHQRGELTRMGEAMSGLDHPDAAERIADELINLAKGNN